MFEICCLLYRELCSNCSNHVRCSLIFSGWMTRICYVTQIDSKADDAKDFHMPVFAYVFTKFKPMPNRVMSILEIASFEEKVERLDSTEKLVESVKQLQNYGLIRQQLNKGLEWRAIVRCTANRCSVSYRLLLYRRESGFYLCDNIPCLNNDALGEQRYYHNAPLHFMLAVLATWMSTSHWICSTKTASNRGVLQKQRN